MSALADLTRLWREDFSRYAKQALVLHTTRDVWQPFVLKPAQAFLHTEIERQKRETGRVRVLLLKARQIGASSYLCGRVHRDMQLAQMRAPVRALLVAQTDRTAQHLMGIHRIFAGNGPAKLTQPVVRGSDHAMVLENGSRIDARTATNPEAGRGQTYSRIHASELAFWPDAEAHDSTTFVQVSKEPGTEITIESTAQGATGSFYARWQAAKSAGPEGEWLPVFVPWYMEPEYAIPVPAGFRLSHEAPNDLVPSEVEYREEHGLSLEQMAWRRREIEDKSQSGRDGALVVAAEFPASPEEAFLSGDAESFISPMHVAAARKRNAPVVGLAARHPLVMGVDPAPEHGSSRTAIIFRRADIAYELQRILLPPEQLRQRIYEIARENDVALLCIDESEGVGHYLVTSLRTAQGMGQRVMGVRFGDTAHDTTRYANRRAEMYDRMRQWMVTGQIPDEPSAPGRSTLASELLGVRRRPDERRIMLERKAEVIKRIGFSPDGADALALTFAGPELGMQTSMGTVLAPGPWDSGPARVIYSGRRGRHFPDGPDDSIVAPVEGVY